MWTAPKVHDMRPGVGEARDTAGPRLETYQRSFTLVHGASSPPGLPKPYGTFLSLLLPLFNAEVSCQTEQTRRTCASSIEPSGRSRIRTFLQTVKFARSSPLSRQRPSLVPQLPGSRIPWVHWIVSRRSQLTIVRFHTGDMESLPQNHRRDHRRPPVRFRNS